MHEFIKGMCPEVGFVRDREWLGKRCPGCDRLRRCSTGQAIKTVVEFEKGVRDKGQGVSPEGKPEAGKTIGVEGMIEKMRPSFAVATANEVPADRNEDEGGAE